MAQLDLTVLPYEEIPQDQINELDQVDIRFYFGYAKKPRKNDFKLQISLSDIESQTISISGQNLISIRTWISYISNSFQLDKPFLLFAKSAQQDIGSGFVSNHVHFASFLRMGIFEFLLITINPDILSRLTKGKKMLPDDLERAILASSNTGPSVEEIINQHQVQRQNNFVEMRNRANNLQTNTVNDVVIQDSTSPLTKITVWRKYSTLLYSINNMCFSIDEHFKNLSRTKPLDEGIVKDVCTEILNRHKNDDQS